MAVSMKLHNINVMQVRMMSEKEEEERKKTTNYSNCGSNSTQMRFRKGLKSLYKKFDVTTAICAYVYHHHRHMNRERER